MVEDWMRGLDAGELTLVVHYFIRNRWLATKRASYAYEVAWVLKRDRGAIGRALKNSVAAGDIERAFSVQCQRRVFYRPTLEDIRDAESSHGTGSFVDEILSDFTKMHDENCPCVKMVDRW